MPFNFLHRIRRAAGARSAALSAAAPGVVLGAVLAAAPAAAASDGPRTLRFLTGQPAGVYYEVGSRLQRRVNANLADHGLMLSTVATTGSEENGRRLLSGESDLAIMQADVVERIVADHLAQTGGTNLPPLKVLAMLMEEWVVLVARGPVASPAELAGRRVAFGAPGSGTRFTALRLLEAAGVPASSLRESSAAASRLSERADLFCRGRIDAAAFVMSLPNPVLRRLVERCGARVVPLSGPAMASLAEASPAYALAATPAASAAPGVTTVQVRAALVQAALGRLEGETLLSAAFAPAGANALNRVVWTGWTGEDAAAIAPLPAADAAKAFFGAPAGGPPPED
ncbi:MAG: TAXI family TRAP transporter solute-binding subunit [Pseudomonadota bacterium]